MLRVGPSEDVGAVGEEAIPSKMDVTIAKAFDSTQGNRTQLSTVSFQEILVCEIPLATSRDFILFSDRTPTSAQQNAASLTDSLQGLVSMHLTIFDSNLRAYYDRRSTLPTTDDRILLSTAM